MPKKKYVPQKYTYYAFYHDKTVKLGYTKDVVSRLRTLGGASSCFICFRAEHDDTHSAKESERQMKKELADFVLRDAECREWLNVKKKGFFSSLIDALIGQAFRIKVFGYAFNVGQKSSTTWEETSPVNVEKLVKYK
ncbi:MAG TPA: hypothetical protein EYO81_00450 [Gammaproteobacteria bacterium]|nr:hypothetical protein [Gammaproteobacteria bacterium]